MQLLPEKIININQINEVHNLQAQADNIFSVQIFTEKVINNIQIKKHLTSKHTTHSGGRCFFQCN